MSIFSAQTLHLPIASRQKYLGLVICAMVAMGGVCSAQSSVLAVASGSGTSGSVVSLQLSLASSPGAEPASVQWTLSYPTSTISNMTVTAAPGIAGGKSLVCSGSTCLLYGLNAQIIQSGPVATLTFQLNATTSGNLPLTLSNVAAASPLGDSLSISAVSGSILATRTPTGALGEIAAGGSLTTGIFILNTGAAPAAYIVQFYDDNGNFAPLPFTTGPSSLLSGTLPPQGSTYLEAGGAQAALVSGWAEIVADPTIVVQALFRNNVNGTYYEAAVPSTPGGKQIMLPFDDTTFATTGQPFVTGIALANMDASNNANIFCTAYGADGSILPNAIQIPSLAPLGHWSGFQFPVLSELGLRGIIQCTSNTNISATALRYLGNELSSLPVVTNPTPAGGAARNGAVAQVSAGGTLTTGIFVLNGGAAPAPFSMNFFADDGTPVALPFTTGSANTISGTLPAQGLAYYEAGNSQIATISGWGQINAGSSVVIQALFRNNVNGIFYEAAVPSTPSGSSEFLYPFDSTTFAGTGQPLVTGVAIANLAPTAATVTCTAFDPTGVPIPNAVTVPPLPPLGHWAGFQFPLLNGLRGTVDCVSNTNVSATALRFLGSALSSLPVVTK